jgi:transposase InsO family protein
LFIQAEKAHYPVRVMCRVLQVSPSGFYAWARRPPSARSRQSEALKPVIAEAHRTSRGTYGSPRVHADLPHQGFVVGRKRVARLMREQGLVGRRPRRYRVTTDSAHEFPIARNVVGRKFVVSEPNRLWATDITYVRTWEGWLYLAVVLDLYSRRVVGWAMADHMRTELVLEALGMAVGQRLPNGRLVHHSDRGSQYASAVYRQVLAEHDITCSMSRAGDCWDNAVVESFFGTLKVELVDTRPWPTRRAARSAIHEYIAVFYNRQRRHSFLGYLTPADYEDREEAVAALAA